MQHGTVSSAERMSPGGIAWPHVRRVPVKTTDKSRTKQAKKRQKRKTIQKIGACGGPWDPISPPHGHPLGPPRRPRDLHSAGARARPHDWPKYRFRSGPPQILISKFRGAAANFEVDFDCQNVSVLAQDRAYRRRTPRCAGTSRLCPLARPFCRERAPAPCKRWLAP